MDQLGVTVSDGGAIPPDVRCWHEVDGELEETVESTDRLDKLEFYQLARSAA